MMQLVLAHLEEIPALDHEVLNHAVKGGVFVALWLLIGSPA
jgi:hypothetical protein